MKQRKFTNAQSRADLIASYDYAKLAEAPPPAPAPEKADPVASDTTVTQAIDAVKKAIDDAVAAQEADPDNGVDPLDAKVMGELQELVKKLPDLTKAQEADSADADKKAEAAPAPEVPKAPVPVKTAAQMPPGDPVDINADAADDHECANPDCGHLASAHTNTGDGKNRGPCGMPGCECPAMQASAEHDQVEGEDDSTPIADEDLAGVPILVPGAAPHDDASTSDLNAPPMVPGGEAMGPEFTAVLIIEGQPTGDGREIAPEALTWRTPPLPLMGMATETHDPEGFDMNDPSVMCGRIDTLTREAGESSTQIIKIKGFYLPNDDGMYFAGLNEAMGRLGISADVAVQASEVSINDVDDMGFPVDMSEVMTEGTVMGGTVCPFPAFEGAYIMLGDGTDTPEVKAIPQAAESPTVPDKPPAVVTAGGQLVHYMTYEECEPCDQGFEVITASGAGPTRPPMSWFSDPGFGQDDGRLVEILDRRGDRGGKFACPITVTDQGQVFGHIAPWDVCHTAFGGQCILAPKSSANYAHFKRGQHITTAEGEKIRVGVLTADTGHASTKLGSTAAMAHYDNTALAIADVNIGEDDYGIWVAGAIRPDASEDQIRKLTASSVSGDWRTMGGQLELVAALCVNQPGFPLAVVAHGRQEALIAAGGNVMHRLKHPVRTSLTVEERVIALEIKESRRRLAALHT